MLKTNFVPKCLNLAVSNTKDWEAMINFFADPANHGFLFPVSSNETKAQIIKDELSKDIYECFCQNRFMIQYSQAILGYRDCQRWIVQIDSSSPFIEYFKKEYSVHLPGVKSFRLDYPDGRELTTYVLLYKCDIQDFMDVFLYWIGCVSKDIYD